MADKLSDAQLEAILSQQIQLAKTHDKTTRRTGRDKAIDYYFGHMDKYVPAEANRSKVVSRDVADVMGVIMPQIMRVFTASHRMAIVEPVSVADVQIADQATDGVNYVFWKENKGYEIVYSATWDSLLHGNGIVKTYYDDTPIYATSFHTGLTEDQVAQLVQDDDVEVLAQTKNEENVEDPETGVETSVETYDLKIKRKKADGKVTIEVIPPEEFLIHSDAVTTDDSPFNAHWQKKTRSELVQMGYDKAEVWTIPVAVRTDTKEAQARMTVHTTDAATDKSMELVDYYESFVNIDVDGDGEAELVRACGAGPNGEVMLDWEVWEDENPFDDIPCEPVPHRWDARSVADEEMDVQDVKTVLTRQMLNNTYWVNNPQRALIGEAKNPEELTTPSFGGTVILSKGSTIQDLPVPYIGDKALEGIHYMDEVSTRRTGIGKQTMALDPETLQNQSATANQNAEDASKAQPELIARNMAEFGWSKVMRKVMRLMIKHEDVPREILVKGKPLQIDPRFWNADMHVTINVGLGTGSRDRDATMLNTVLTQQITYTDRIAQAFPEKALDMLPYIHNTLTKFAEATGLKNPELYWPEINPDEIQAGKDELAKRAQVPPPEIQIAQMKAQSDQAIQASEQKSNEIRAQAEAEKIRTEAQIKLMEAQAVQRQAALEAELAQAQLQIKQLEIASKSDTEMKKAWLSSLTSLEVAEINAKNNAQAQILEAQIATNAGLQDHLQSVEMANLTHDNSMAAQAAAPKPQPGA